MQFKARLKELLVLVITPISDIMYHLLSEVQQGLTVVCAEVIDSHNVLFICSSQALYFYDSALYTLLHQPVHLYYDVASAAFVPPCFLLICDYQLRYAVLKLDFERGTFRTVHSEKKVVKESRIKRIRPFLSVCLSREIAILYSGSNGLLLSIKAEQEFKVTKSEELRLRNSDIVQVSALSYHGHLGMLVRLECGGYTLQLMQLSRSSSFIIKHQKLIDKLAAKSFRECSQSVVVIARGSLIVLSSSLEVLFSLLIALEVEDVIHNGRCFVFTGQRTGLFNSETITVLDQQSHLKVKHLGMNSILLYGSTYPATVCQIDSLNNVSKKRLGSAGAIYQLQPLQSENLSSLAIFHLSRNWQSITIGEVCTSFKTESVIEQADVVQSLVNFEDTSSLLGVNFIGSAAVFHIDGLSMRAVVQIPQSTILAAYESTLVTNKGVFILSVQEGAVTPVMESQIRAAALGRPFSTYLLRHNVLHTYSQDKTLVQSYQSPKAISSILHIDSQTLAVAHFGSSQIELRNFISGATRLITLNTSSTVNSMAQISNVLLFGLYDGTAATYGNSLFHFGVDALPVFCKTLGKQPVFISAGKCYTLVGQTISRLDQKAWDCALVNGKIAIVNGNKISLGQFAGQGFQRAVWEPRTSSLFTPQVISASRGVLAVLGSHKIFYQSFKGKRREQLPSSVKEVYYAHLSSQRRLLVAGTSKEGASIVQVHIQSKVNVTVVQEQLVFCKWLPGQTGFIAVTAGAVLVYEVVQGQNLQTSLLFQSKTSISHDTVELNHQGDLLAIGSICVGVSLFRINHKTQMVYPLAFTTLPYGLTEIKFLNKKLLVADETNHVFVFAQRLSPKCDLQRIELRFQGQLRLGSQITCFGESEQLDSRSARVRIALQDGSVCTVTQVTKDDYRVLKQLQSKAKAYFSEGQPLTYEEWCPNSEQNNFIDGRLIQRMLKQGYQGQHQLFRTVLARAVCKPSDQ